MPRRVSSFSATASTLSFTADRDQSWGVIYRNVGIAVDFLADLADSVFIETLDDNHCAISWRDRGLHQFTSTATYLQRIIKTERATRNECRIFTEVVPSNHRRLKPIFLDQSPCCDRNREYCRLCVGCKVKRLFRTLEDELTQPFSKMSSAFSKTDLPNRVVCIQMSAHPHILSRLT